ncbi:MAG: toprim domain-containing protein [Planctomycetes bacterium]|nr:toprim domain-containing protein [Planctomycetota bacterium]
MAKRPYVSFAEIKEKVPIPDVLATLGIAEQFARKGNSLTGVCPLPGHKHGPSPNPEQFKINRKDGVWLWHCFGDCQIGGDVIELVKRMTGYDNSHVRFWFAENFGDRLSLSKTSRARKKGGEQLAEGKVEKDTARTDLPQEDAAQAAPQAPSNLPEASAELKPLRFHLNLDPDVSYLRQRGLAPETIQRYGVGLCRRGVLKDYVAIPVFLPHQPADENPVAYLGRWPGADHDEAAGRPRYKWPEGFPKHRVLYGLREALAVPSDSPLFVVEGPFDLYHTVQAGFPATVAVLGSSLSDEQATLLASTGRKLVLMFDGDEAGQTGMRLAAGKLITRAWIRVVKLPAGKQPDEFPADELRAMLTFR